MTINRNVQAFLRELRPFQHALSSIDRVWDVICPDRGSEWIHIADPEDVRLRLLEPREF